jgi:aminoglycoside/choline kinase family phosphotransferase
MSERDRIIDEFLARAGWTDAERRPLAGDASFRRYERVRRGEKFAVLMDAPPPKEDTRPFVAVTRHLQALGYCAPELYAEDAAAGLLLLEDLGDATYGRVLAEGADRATLYDAAVDLLVDLHAKPESATVPVWLPPYDEARILVEAELLTDWYMPLMFGRPTDAGVKRAYQDIWRGFLPILQASGRTLVLRDFFADNLMWLPGRPGVKKVGLLDYQDALAGSPAYDLMSLIEDARRDIDPALEARLLARYRAARPAIDHDAFRAAYVILAAQRHCKVIGIFTRLSVRDGKAGYLVHIPRLWRLLERACRDPLLAPLAHWLDDAIPAAARKMPEPEAAL